jgi:protein-tyrosine kinase
MSLVERALKKARDAQRAKSPEDAGAVEVPDAPPEFSPEPAHAIAEPPVSSPPGAAVAHARHIVLNRQVIRDAGYLGSEEQMNEMTEQFRHIKRPLVARALGRGAERAARGNVIMVTSAVPGEGKTFCAFNLALSLAFEQDIEVLLMDADFRSPQLSQVLGLHQDSGLGDALGNPALDPDSLVVATDVPTFSLLPAGRWLETPTELLASARMDAVVARLQASAPSRVIVMDAPPLLLTNEAKVLVDVAGQVVLVVRANSTPQRAVTDAMGYLRRDQFVGLVLNQSETVPGLGYGYGYYEGIYTYGGYGGERAAPRA